MQEASATVESDTALQCNVMRCDTPGCENEVEETLPEGQWCTRCYEDVRRTKLKLLSRRFLRNA